jgi:hypothetical protein
MGSARFYWGMFSAKPIRRWHPRIEVLEALRVFSQFDDRAFSNPQVLKMARMLDWMRAMMIVQPRFKD